MPWFVLFGTRETELRVMSMGKSGAKNVLSHGPFGNEKYEESLRAEEDEMRGRLSSLTGPWHRRRNSQATTIIFSIHVEVVGDSEWSLNIEYIFQPPVRSIETSSSLSLIGCSQKWTAVRFDISEETRTIIIY